jgi:hypothetical protein
MAIVEFEFKAHHSWTMGPACGNVINASVNPAPTTSGCIYIIHNSAENSTYVGYAEDAQHRWSTRTEVFHIMGIPRNYADRILCAYCKPSVDSGKSMWLEGKHNCEHLLIRGVVNGLLGVTTSTNSQLGGQYFVNKIATQMRVYLPTDPWGRLEGRKQCTVTNPF